MSRRAGVAQGRHLRAADSRRRGRLAFGEPILDAVRTYLGSPLGPMRARDGNVHRGQPKEGLLPMISHLGAMISVVNGALLARRFNGISGTVGAACIGDGAHFDRRFSRGDKPGGGGETAAGADRRQQPIRLLDPDRSGSLPAVRCWTRRRATGSRATRVDGTDLAACLKVVGEARRAGRGPAAARKWSWPSCLRLCGHGEHDDAGYIDPKLKAVAARAGLFESGRGAFAARTTGPMRRRWRPGGTRRSSKWKRAVAKVQREPGPDPYKEDWCALASKHLSEGHDVVVEHRE